MQIVDALSGEVQQNFVTTEASVISLIWTSDEARIITGTYNEDGEDIFVWDVLSGQELMRLNGAVYQIALSHDGRYLAGANYDAKIWDMTTLQVVDVFITPDDRNNYVTKVAWHPSNNVLITGGWNGAIYLWDMESDTPQFFEASPAYTRETSNRRSVSISDEQLAKTNVLAIGFNSDGTRFMSVAADGTTRQWDTETGALIAEAQLPSVVTATWSPDGTRLAYVPFSDDGTRAETGVTIVSPFEQP